MDAPPQPQKSNRPMIIASVVSALGLAWLAYHFYTRQETGPQSNLPANNTAVTPAAGNQHNTAWNSEVLGRHLKDADPEVQKQALESIREWCAAEPDNAAYPLENSLGKRLLEVRRYQELADLTLQCVMEVPTRTDTVAGLLRLRAAALIGLGKYPEALQAARSMWNVCALEHADEALTLMGHCLALAHPEDPALYRRFMDEQRAGLTAATPPESTLITAITIDSAPYDVALSVRMDETESETIMEHLDLALLAGKLDEADQTLPKLRNLSPQRLAETQARILKARDGTLGRANAFIAGQLMHANPLQPLHLKPGRTPWPEPTATLTVPLAKLPFSAGGTPLVSPTAKITVPFATLPAAWRRAP